MRAGGGGLPGGGGGAAWVGGGGALLGGGGAGGAGAPVPDEPLRLGIDGGLPRFGGGLAAVNSEEMNKRRSPLIRYATHLVHFPLASALAYRLQTTLPAAVGRHL